MNDKNKDVKINTLLQNSKHITIIVHIKQGEINVQTSGPPMEYLIINEDSKMITIKKVRDCFMVIPNIIKSFHEKWENLQKKKP